MVKVSIFEVVANLVVISDDAALSVILDTVSKTNGYHCRLRSQKHT